MTGNTCCHAFTSPTHPCDAISRVHACSLSSLERLVLIHRFARNPRISGPACDKILGIPTRSRLLFHSPRRSRPLLPTSREKRPKGNLRTQASLLLYHSNLAPLVLAPTGGKEATSGSRSRLITLILGRRRNSRSSSRMLCAVRTSPIHLLTRVTQLQCDCDGEQRERRRG